MPGTEDGFGGVLRTLQPLEHLFVIAAMSSLRLLAAFALMPPMGQKFLHGLVRNGIVALLAIYVAFGAPYDVIEHFTVVDFIIHGFKEVLIGLLLGFVGAQVFWIAECVGALIDAHSGYNNAQMTSPLTGTPSTPVSDLLLQLVSAVFFSVGGMLVFLEAVFASYRLWPVGAPAPQLAWLTDAFVIDQVGIMMESIVKFAAPLVIVLMLIELGFGLVTRGAPRLEVNTLAQPVKGAVTVLMLALLSVTFIPQVRSMMTPVGLLESIVSRLGKSR